jgi:hypothetical protein
MAPPGIVTRFAPTGNQLAVSFDACDHATDERLLDTAAGVGAAIPAMLAGGWEFVRLAGQSVQ